MTDGEVRARLDRLERGDPVSGTLRTLMCLQFAAVYLISGPLTDLYAWLAYFLLAALPVVRLLGGMRRRREARTAPEIVRRRYEELLPIAIEKARRRRDHIGWQGAMAVVIGGMVLVMKEGRGRETGLVIALMSFLQALDHYQHWKWVLPRLQAEQGEYRDMLIGLGGP